MFHVFPCPFIISSEILIRTTAPFDLLFAFAVHLISHIDQTIASIRSCLTSQIHLISFKLFKPLLSFHLLSTFQIHSISLELCIVLSFHVKTRPAQNLSRLTRIFEVL